MKPKTRLLPAVMSILIMTSLFCPVVNAAPSGIEEPELGVAVALVPAAVAAPEVCNLIISGVTIVVSGVFAVEIGKNLGKTWDGIAEHWDHFLTGVQKGLNDLIHAKKWVDVTSNEGKALMTVIYEYYTSQGGASGGKKDDKWYFEYRKNHDKVEINSEAMTEEQAVKEMGRGKNIMTVHKELAKKLVGRYEGIPENEVEFETSRVTRDISYEHAHYYAHGQRLHCSIWRSP